MKYLLFFLLMSSCSTLRPGPKLSENSDEAPSWVYSPYDECDQTLELCATGEGVNTTQADTAAKANLGSIFEVKVQSELNVSSSHSGNSSWQGRVGEEVQKTIKESVDQILETVQIKKHFRKDGFSYALASIDRVKAGQLLGDRLVKIDHELEALWERQQRTNFRKIVKLYTERERLNERYSIVAGVGRPSRVSWQEIVKWRETRPKEERLLFKVGQAPEWMTEKIHELLTEAGFRIVKTDASKIVSIQVDTIKEFLNVSGFEKHTFILSMTSIIDGQKKKMISTSETVTGRSQADALLKVKNYFTEYIESHLSDLHLD